MTPDPPQQTNLNTSNFKIYVLNYKSMENYVLTIGIFKLIIIIN